MHEYVTQDTSLQAASSPGSPSSTLSILLMISDSCSKISREMDWHVINIMQHYKTVTKCFPFQVIHWLGLKHSVLWLFGLLWSPSEHGSEGCSSTDYTQWSTAYTLLHTHLGLLEFTHVVENVSRMTSCHIGQ